MKSLILPNKLKGETALLTFDFTSALSSNDTLSGVPAVVVTPYMGADPTVFGMVLGAATRVGNTVTQKITAGIEGNTYIVTCSCPTTASELLELQGYLTIIPGLGGG